MASKTNRHPTLGPVVPVRYHLRPIFETSLPNLASASCFERLRGLKKILGCRLERDTLQGMDTYPTWGSSENHLQNAIFWGGDMLVSWRVSPHNRKSLSTL